MLPARVRCLRDERELRIERQRHVTDQAAEELVPDRTRGSLGNGAEQVPARESRTGEVDVNVRRHEPVPSFDASAPLRLSRHREASLWPRRTRQRVVEAQLASATLAREPGHAR